MIKKFNKTVIIFIAVLFYIFIIAATTKVRVVVKDAQGRSGPGSFYELVALIPENTVLETTSQKKSWFKVTYKKKEIWISENSISTNFTSKPRTQNSPETANNSDISITASPTVLTAAIKGFWTRYTGSDKKNLYEIPVNGYDLSGQNIENFIEKRFKEVSRDDLLKKIKLRSSYKDSPKSYGKEQMSGYAIASSLADSPLLSDMKVIEYISSVGNYLSEATERNDIGYKFIILDTDHINAVSCPGGYIVITRGLLKIVSDESELAALLAHEMSHIIAGHFEKNVKENKVNIAADSAFETLDNSTSSDKSKAEEDLINITQRAFSIATSPKTDEQEFEADRMALNYMARSGYDLGGMASLLNKMMKEHEEKIDIFDLNYKNHPDFTKRIERINRETDRYKNLKGYTFADSYTANTSF